MNDLQNIRLGNVVDIKSSKRVKMSDYKNEGVPFYRSKEIIQKASGQKINTEIFISNLQYESFRQKHGAPVKGDLLLTSVGTLGIPYLVKESDENFYFKDGNLTWFSNFSSSLDSKYLFYFLKSREGKQILNEISIGSTQAALTIEGLKNISLNLPSISKQKIVTHILGKIDEKIVLNQKNNETFEEIAKALFKSWFIDFDPVRAKVEGRSTGLPDEISDLFPDSFEESELGEIPKSWEITCLDELTDFVIGGDWGKDKKSNQYPSKVLCIRGADIPKLQEFGYGEMPTRFIKLDSFNKRSLIDGDIILEISGGSPTQSTGRPVLLEKRLFERFKIPLMCSNFCRIIRLKSNKLSPFIYYFLKHLYDKEEMFMYETGTTGIKNFGYNYFASSRKFTIPNQKLLSIYSKFIRSIRESSNLRGTQSGTLLQIRDTLLPKLISGELRIPDAEKIIEEVEI